MFPLCREKMIEMPELVKNICRIFYYKVSRDFSPDIGSSFFLEIKIIVYGKLILLC
jgi:hypothetical protein